MPTVNEPLIRQIVEHIEANPAEWNQSSYGRKTDCGTTYCIAGWAMVFSDVELEWGDSYGASCTVEVTADGQPIWDAAKNVLGLTSEQANQIFFHGYINKDATIDSMKERITEVTGIEFKSEKD